MGRCLRGPSLKYFGFFVKFCMSWWKYWNNEQIPWKSSHFSPILPRLLQGFLIWVLHCMRRNEQEDSVRTRSRDDNRIWTRREDQQRWVSGQKKVRKKERNSLCTDGIQCQWCGPGSWSSWTAGWLHDEPIQTCPGSLLAWSLPGKPEMRSLPQGPWRAELHCRAESTVRALRAWHVLYLKPPNVIDDHNVWNARNVLPSAP